jgi:hypothetical protein
MSSRSRSAAALLLAVISTSCGSREPQGVLTVEEVVSRIDELNGQTISVAGYLSECGGYDCILYRTKADSDEVDRFMAAAPADMRVPFPDVPMLGIGTGTNFDFDAKAAPFTNSYVVITGTISNVCRVEGKVTCMDRVPDLDPTAIRAGSPPTRGQASD